MLADLTDWVPLLSTALLVVFGGGGIVLLYKARDERDAIIVGSAKNIAEGANSLVVASRQELEDVRADMAAQEERHKAEMADLRAALAEAQTYQAKVRDLESQLATERAARENLTIQRDTLAEKVGLLQAEVAELRAEVQNGKT